jgi:hypothetical protein
VLFRLLMVDGFFPAKPIVGQRGALVSRPSPSYTFPGFCNRSRDFIIVQVVGKTKNKRERT